MLDKNDTLLFCPKSQLRLQYLEKMHQNDHNSGDTLLKMRIPIEKVTIGCLHKRSWPFHKGSTQDCRLGEKSVGSLPQQIVLWQCDRHRRLCESCRTSRGLCNWYQRYSPRVVHHEKVTWTKKLPVQHITNNKEKICSTVALIDCPSVDCPRITWRHGS